MVENSMKKVRILSALNLATCVLPHQVEQMVTYTLMIDNFKLQVRLYS